MKKNRKLTLNKEKIGSLSNMNEVIGGKADLIDGGGSTEHNFTCGWCTTFTHVSEGHSCLVFDTVCS